MNKTQLFLPNFTQPGKSLILQPCSQLLLAAFVSGWGAINEGGPISDTLKWAAVKVLDNSDCADYAYGQQITPNMMCATAPGRDSCQGDSGGPLVTGWRNKINFYFFTV